MWIHLIITTTTIIKINVWIELEIIIIHWFYYKYFRIKYQKDQAIKSWSDMILVIYLIYILSFRSCFFFFHNNIISACCVYRVKPQHQSTWNKKKFNTILLDFFLSCLRSLSLLQNSFIFQSFISFLFSPIKKCFLFLFDLIELITNNKYQFCFIFFTEHIDWYASFLVGWRKQNIFGKNDGKNQDNFSSMYESTETNVKLKDVSKWWWFFKLQYRTYWNCHC